MKTKECFSDPNGCKIKEHQGFLKNVCRKERSNQLLKCVYSDEIYAISYTYGGSGNSINTICSNDPHFYQMCNKEIGGKITNNEVLCEHYLCKEHWTHEVQTSYSLIKDGILCENICMNTDLNIKGCDSQIDQPTGSPENLSKICNNVCDTYDCKDEAVCNGYTYGIFCETKSGNEKYVQPQYICDGIPSCGQGEDETNCTATENDTVQTCKHGQIPGKLVPVHNFTRCATATQLYCEFEDIKLFQTNCSDIARVGGSCEIDGYMSTVAKFPICNDVLEKKYNNKKIMLCDDDIHSRCFRTKSCTIHKHLMCDKKDDCDDKADENHRYCSSTTKGTCKRRFGKMGELPIPTAWLGDGERDCENGADETSSWPMCGRGKTLRYLLNEYDQCENVFICRTGNPGYVELNKLCDGLNSCGNENEVCSVSSRPYSVTTTVSTTSSGLAKHLSFCQDGLKSLEILRSGCINEQFSFPDKEIFGVDKKTSLVLPDASQTCDFMYGELYLYTSCTGRCSSSSCPLQTIPRYEVCPDQFPGRIGTIVNNEYLIFVTRSSGSLYSNTYFVCDDKIKCIDYSKVCDLVYDCWDRSDELNCTNHFKCNTSQNLLPKTKKCNGKIDCADLSDECNEQCFKTILEGAFLEGLSLTIGALAVAANLVIIGRSLWTVKRCKTSVAVVNRCLIIMIALGDFFIGCYLLTIAIYDTIIHKGDYCKRQVDWITSLECSVIGVFSTIGSQISLFSMTGLSLVRIHGIWNSMSIPGEVNRAKVLKIAVMMLFLLLGSTAIALIPILGELEDFFVNGVKFSTKLKIFIGASDKATIFSVLQAYFGRSRDSRLSWKLLIHMVGEMFSKNYGDLTERVDKVDFYGNDGVCLFKSSTS